MKKVIALLAVLSWGLQLWAQAPVIVTKNTKTINGKKYYAHVVEKGQTVFSIARAYGVNYREAVLKNDIDKIAIGDTIFLPVNEVATPTNFRYYVVKQGNTLYSIAKTYKVEVDDILKLNPNIENNSIKVGEVIKIPMMNSSNGNDNKPQTSQPQQNSVNSQSQQPAPIYKPIKDSKQEAKEQKELEKQQKEAEAKAKKEQERLQKEAQEKEAKEKKELERLQKEAKAKEAKEKKELEKQQKEAEAKAKKEQERLQKEAEAKEAKEKKELEKKQKEAKEK
ncbi:MAG: LysM peptidoglycan-binding domain-containing protein, partial [Bacteroidales bacterium]|nr:LysM peptidoglycan-binding domain-containing protein [Bacteroidales bacterium]